VAGETALTMVVVGVLVGWLPGSWGPPVAVRMPGLVLVLTGVVTLVAGRWRWRAIRLAIGAGAPMPATRLPLLVSGVVTGTGLLLVVLMLVGGRR